MDPQQQQMPSRDVQGAEVAKIYFERVKQSQDTVQAVMAKLSQFADSKSLEGKDAREWQALRKEVVDRIAELESIRDSGLAFSRDAQTALVKLQVQLEFIDTTVIEYFRQQQQRAV